MLWKRMDYRATPSHSLVNRSEDFLVMCAAKLFLCCSDRNFVSISAIKFSVFVQFGD